MKITDFDVSETHPDEFWRMITEAAQVAKLFGKAAARGLLRDTDGVDLWKAHAATLLELSGACLVIAKRVDRKHKVTWDDREWLFRASGFLELRDDSRLLRGRWEDLYTAEGDSLDPQFRSKFDQEICEQMEEIREATARLRKKGRKRVV